MLLADTGAVINAVPKNAINSDTVSAGKALAFGLTTTPTPASYPGKPVFGAAFWYAGITRSSRHKAESRAFIRHLAEQAPLIAARAGGIPWNSGTTGGSFAEEDPLIAKMYNIYHAGETALLPPSAPPPTATPTEGAERFGGAVLFEAIVTEELRRMFEDGQSPEDTAANVQRRWESR
jgi:hypothetical protein